ncbi:PepSY domain-containing protein [Tabrizicola piscis]|uniref:PepSY domain-containing protein n=1 Tax=Tabrizicola piscis TaxID=2494374 RepID=A0A3S8U3I8_9RHOB|nr:PepSY domain-containing protein [Tabrizicola piscis]AZL58182.1 PepSY domain-containing protein [Tabrizicola piscis]
MIGISTRLMLTLALITAPAFAGDDCAVPMTDWQPREAVMRLAAENGWNLRRIRIDDGCYEVIGRDAEGRSIEVKLDPATLAVIEMEFEEVHEDEDEQEEDGHDD